MPMHFARKSFLVAAIVALPLVSPSAQDTTARSRQGAATRIVGRQFTVADLRGWKSIRSPVLSDDGKWFGYVLAPNDGNAKVVLRQTADGGKELGFPIGEPPAPAPGAPGAGGAGPSVTISGDAKYAAFIVFPSKAPARRGRGDRASPPPQNKVDVVNLATGEKKEFDRIRRFAFNGEKPTWIALYAYAPPAPAAENPAASATPPGGQGAPRAERNSGADLVLYNLSTGESVNIGNVAEFGFDDSGTWLAYTIDARDAIGNGVQLRNMRTDVVRSLDSDHALYRQLAWSDSGVALAVLRGRPDSVSRDTLYSVLSFTDFRAEGPKKTVFDPSQHADFPTGMTVSAERAPKFADDMSAVFFGIRAVEKHPATMAANDGRAVVQAGAPGAGGTINQPRVQNNDEDLPTLVLWHWKDPRLQSQQMVQLTQDKAYSYLAEYRFTENRTIRLADDALRTVTPLPHEHFAVGLDSREYDQPASYSGRRYEDVYRIDLKTGDRKLVLKKHPSANQFGGPGGAGGIPSPDGGRVLYWGEDGNWWVLDAATGDIRNITRDVSTTFANTEDDHNNLYPPSRPAFGWSKDGSAVVLYDGWDAWKVPVKGGAAVNLTGDGRTSQVRYQTLYGQDEGARAPGNRGRRAASEQGIDLSKPLFFGTYGEWTKKEGLARVEPGRAGAKVLVVDDAKYSFTKAKDADTWLYTRQTFNDFPDYYVASADFKTGRRITDANPQQKEFAWSSGTRLIDYTSDKGDKLQGALYLPANYEPGRKYPLLVTIYEKRSQGLHQYVNPSDTRTPDPSVYTSRGYAVLDPDIVYRVNDPGMSAVWCVVPAVKAAIATGIVDSAHVGLWGHSWGGYQTAFLVTQTNIFKAAIAGAPLTDMVSMYSSIYWNTGGTNQAIFEASQGRFKGNYTDNYDAYIRNSPVFHAKNVQTPLIILHDDKDGAVDFNQGITYFNTLRQLGKEVILLEYIGENHGLARPVNQKDYAIRQREWFDHYLKGAASPAWMTDGIPRLKMEEDLRARAALTQAKPDVVP